VNKRPAKTAVKLGVLIFTVVSAATAADSNDPSISQCGINALYSCMHYLQAGVRLDQLYENIPRTSNNQVNLEQLARYARTSGLNVKAVKRPGPADVRQYVTSSSPGIVQYKYPDGKGHIVALLRPEDRDIWVFDVPANKSIVSDEKLCTLLEESEGLLIVSRTTFKQRVSGVLNASTGTWFALSAFSLGLLAISIISVKHGREKTTTVR